MSTEVEFAKYFVERLKQCGVKAVFGVPGDYNLELWAVPQATALYWLTVTG